MGMKHTQALENQRASFERQLDERLAAMTKKGVAGQAADKDPIVRRLRARLKAVKARLQAIADAEKRARDVAQEKAAKLAAPKKEPEAGKPEKPKKAAGEGKEKKPKPEKAAAPKAKAKEGGEKPKPKAPAPEAG